MGLLLLLVTLMSLESLRGFLFHNVKVRLGVFDDIGVFFGENLVHG